MEAHQSSYYFDPKKVGEDLAEVAVELIRVEDQQVQSRWFHSRYETDLFIWSDENNHIIKQQLSFYGQIVEWNFVDGTRTGFIIEDEAGNTNIKASETVHFDKESQVTTIEMAVQIVGFLNTDALLKEKLIHQFQGKSKPVAKKSRLAKLLSRFKK